MRAGRDACGTNKAEFATSSHENGSRFFGMMKKGKGGTSAAARGGAEGGNGEVPRTKRACEEGAGCFEAGESSTDDEPAKRSFD